MRFLSEQRHDGLVERDFDLDGVPGVLWTPAAPSQPAPLILMGHPGGLPSMRPRLASRARHSAAGGFATATLELPGAGDRPALPAVDRARAELRRAVHAGERPSEDVVDALVLPLVDAAVPEWRAALDALLMRPEIGDAVGFSGGVAAIAVRFAAVEPRLRALGLFAGSWIPRATFEDARRVTVPVHMLLQWDDADNDRQQALGLFDALGSTEKTLQANLGGHTGVPPWAAEDAGRFFARHLRPVVLSAAVDERDAP